MITKSELISTVINKIEDKFPNAIVMWTREGYPEMGSSRSTVQVFEALGIKEDEYESFLGLVRELKRTHARPNGFSIMVHDLTPDEVRKYRGSEYQAEITRRKQVEKGKKVRDKIYITQIGIEYKIIQPPQHCQQHSDINRKLSQSIKSMIFKNSESFKKKVQGRKWNSLNGDTAVGVTGEPIAA